MGVQENTVSILRELEQNALNIDNDQAQHFIGQIRNAKHIFLQGAGAAVLPSARSLTVYCI